jgi:hypothetical protein
MPDKKTPPNTFEAVYYSQPVAPSSTLALLALTFDRVVFPGVTIPTSGVDHDALRAEIQRLDGIEIHGAEDHYLRGALRYALNARHLTDFCVFAGGSDEARKDDEARHLGRLLEELHFGPPSKNFIPTITLNWSKAVPGDGDLCVAGPGAFTYPARALLHSAQHGVLLVNDNPRLPVPAAGGTADPRLEARRLATVLAIEAVRLVLPTLPAMSFEQIAEMRAECATFAGPFRASMLRLSRELSAALVSEASLDEVRQQARFVVETSVLPELVELRSQVAQKATFYRRAVDLAKSAPELALNFATLPTNIAAAKVLAQLATLFADIRDAQLEREGVGMRGAAHYLLRVQRHNPAE